MVRSAVAGMSEVNPKVEEAALLAGASPFTIRRKIVLPIIARHIAAGALLSFAFCMLEVSDSFILALEQRFFPISKAMYMVLGRPDGPELASALGVTVSLLLMFCFWGAARIQYDSRS